MSGGIAQGSIRDTIGRSALFRYGTITFSILLSGLCVRDADGAGVSGSIAFATLPPGQVLTNTSFTIT
ncbi:MAG: hypothetical protein DCF23_10100 [Cyanobium sp.]|nr:MAG: hypothetical protein DCF23_10100 [Cyanobium sp.]